LQWEKRRGLGLCSASLLFGVRISRVFTRDGKDVCKQQRAAKHQDRPHPVVDGKGVLEVDDGKQQRRELSQSYNESDRQRRAFGG